MPDFLRDAQALVERLVPGVRTVAFGHLGDGNIHFNLTQPAGADRAAFLDRWEEVNGAVHDLVQSYQGSISAEHGVGRMKVAEIRQRKAPVEIELMERVKRALDPRGLMNPGKML